MEELLVESEDRAQGRGVEGAIDAADAKASGKPSVARHPDEQKKIMDRYVGQGLLAAGLYTTGLVIAAVIGGPVGILAGAIVQKCAVACAASVIMAACADARTAANENIKNITRACRETIDHLTSGKHGKNKTAQAEPEAPAAAPQAELDRGIVLGGKNLPPPGSYAAVFREVAARAQPPEQRPVVRPAYAAAMTNG